VLQSSSAQLADSLTPTHFHRWVEAGCTLSQQKMGRSRRFPRTGTTLLETGSRQPSRFGEFPTERERVWPRHFLPAMWPHRKDTAATADVFDAIPLERLSAQRTRY